MAFYLSSYISLFVQFDNVHQWCWFHKLRSDYPSLLCLLMTFSSNTRSAVIWPPKSSSKGVDDDDDDRQAADGHIHLYEYNFVYNFTMYINGLGFTK